MNLHELTNAIGRALGTLHLPNTPVVMPLHRVLSSEHVGVVAVRGRMALARLPLPKPTGRPGSDRPVFALPIGDAEVASILRPVVAPTETFIDRVLADAGAH